MNKSRAVALSFLALALLTASVFGQGRPRRVGPPPTDDPTSTRTTPSTTTPQRPAAGTQANKNIDLNRPPAPPILRGSNEDPNRQQPSATAQKENGPEEYGEGDTLRVDTTLVSLPVTVMDRDGKFIPNLRKEDFRIWENGVEQQVAYFASTEKPFTVALVIDTSGSTKNKLEEIQDAAIAFIEQLRADDRVMIVAFSDKIRVLTEPTSDRFILRDAIRETSAGSGTRLYDAVDLVINQYFNRIEGRKALVLFTDGVDTTSNRADYDSTLRDAEELDALIYPVEYDTYSDMADLGGGWPGGGRRGGRHGGGSSGGNGSVIDDIFSIILGGGVTVGNGGGGGGGRRGGGHSGTSREEYERGDQYLHDLARVTGARLYNAEQQNLDYAFRSVAEELRRQYSLGYYPKTKPVVGERRGIRVRVTRPELVVRTRDSYIFQPNANASAQTQTQQKPPVLRK
ncbi:MAG TPA: VWA domain-containing protein [Pyrinomonadaceae bacterium]|nr:VWA domain-containing protein [Pyrinomonadaceae bacterium]